jgi:Uma2 family endonuclease
MTMNPRSMSVSSVPKPPPRGVDLPCDDGEPMETWRHRRQASVILDSLNDAWRNRDDYFAAANMFLYFSETQSRNNDFRGPDVFVVLDTEKRERRSWVVWEEGGRTPDVVFELVSQSTEDIDRGPKMEIYARVLHVACYVIFDPFTAQLDVFRLDASKRAYVRVEPDARGHYACEPLQLSLGVVQGVIDGVDAPWLRLIDDHGEVLPEPAERATRESERATREAERATREAQRAAQAEAEVARLRDELARRGG